MLIITHGLIADYVHGHLKEKSLFIDKRAFRYGNILPDIDPYLRRKSHRYRDDHRYLLNKIATLPFSSADRQELSLQLGVACHFISDFFCRCHNCQKDNFLSHFIYESAVHLSLKELLKTRTPLVSANPLFHNTCCITDSIIEVREHYLPSETAIQTDLLFAINCSIMVCDWVIDAYYSHDIDSNKTLTA